MKRKYDKAHKDWARQVKERDHNLCVICKSNKHLCAHHLIPWEVKRFRLYVNNGITLCMKHHTKYGHGLSPHSDGAGLFFLWLIENKPKIWSWFKNNVTN